MYEVSSTYMVYKMIYCVESPVAMNDDDPGSQLDERLARFEQRWTSNCFGLNDVLLHEGENIPIEELSYDQLLTAHVEICSKWSAYPPIENMTIEGKKVELQGYFHLNNQWKYPYKWHDEMTLEEIIEELGLHGIDGTQMTLETLNNTWIEVRLTKFRVIICDNVNRQEDADQEERPDESDQSDDDMD